MKEDLGPSPEPNPNIPSPAAKVGGGELSPGIVALNFSLGERKKKRKKEEN